MSEYQYYEFQAIDRPLTEKEMDELRSYSSRAIITPTSFVNEYSWGNFKGDEEAWMEKYFDSFLYLANWGSHVLKLRLPSKLLDLETAQDYCAGESAFVRAKGSKMIFSFISEDEDGGEWIDGQGILSSLISVRAELVSGDLRALYLGWLLCAQNGELDEECLEPVVPAGLGQLSPSLTSLSDFLRIDSNILAVASQASELLDDRILGVQEVSEWIATVPADEKDNILSNLITEGDSALITDLRRRYLKERNDSKKHDDAFVTRRTAGEILRVAEIYAEEQQRIATQKRIEDKTRREGEARIARAKHLDSIASDAERVWLQVESLIVTKQPKSYAKAVELLVDLRDVAQRDGQDAGFNRRLEAIRSAHLRKPAFVERLRKAGLRGTRRS